MAVFTAIATAIVGAIGMTGFVATLATSIISAGLALGTAKLLGVMDPPTQQATKDPGVKIQLPPSTDNRIPVFYGRNHSGAIIVDAEIKNQNNTMVYCMVIGEKTDTGAITINQIYRDDAKLNFSGANVISMTDPNATTSTNVANKMRVRVFAGNAQSSVNQIFPTTGKVAAQTLMSTITTATNYEDLVYAIYEMDYDAENGMQGLGAITYDITNSLSEPSNVLLDYITNDRYGCGISTSDLDLTSFNELYDYSTAQVDYLDSLGATQQQNRWQIDGMLSTYVPVKNNINELVKSCSSYFAYNPKQGKFMVVPNREATTAEKNAAYLFNDDNITSSIDITSTELFSLYNSIDAEYPAVNKKDQTQTVIISTPSADRNNNEPDNPLSTRFSIVNDKSRVYNLADIDLRQSRESLVLSFTADYSAIVNDVGDIVKVTSAIYGFTNKLFRIMRVTEVETADAMLGAKVQMIEYADSIYAHTSIQTDTVPGLSGIPNWGIGIWGNIDYGNIANIVGNITIVDDPVGGSNANIVAPGTGTVIGNVDYANIDFTGIGGEGGFGGVGNFPFINFPVTIPNIPGITSIDACVDPIGSSVSSNVANSSPGSRVQIRPGGRDGRDRTTFDPGEVVNVAIPTPALPLQDITAPVGPLLPDILANIDLSFFGISGINTIRATAPNISLKPTGTIDRGSIGAVQAGLQIEEDGFNASMANSATTSVPLGINAALITANAIIDAGGIDEGIFSAVNNMVPYGATLADGNAAISYQPFRQINYKAVDVAPDGKMTANAAMANSGIHQLALGSGIVASGISQLGTFDDNFKYEVSRAKGNVVATGGGLPPQSSILQYIPQDVIVGNWANTNLSPSGAGRRLDVTNSDKRISKSDFYLDIGNIF